MIKVKGFTLVELMVTIAIAAILLVVGAPSLNNLYQNVRVGLGAKKIQQTMIYARGQAISLSQNVTVCHRSGNNCDKNWSDGITVFVDQNSNGVFDDGDMDLQHIEAFNDNIRVTSRQSFYHFQGDGMAFGSAGNIIYCPEDANHVSPQKIVIDNNGRIKAEKSDASNCPGANQAAREGF